MKTLFKPGVVFRFHVGLFQSVTWLPDGIGPRKTILALLNLAGVLRSSGVF